MTGITGLVIIVGIGAVVFLLFIMPHNVRAKKAREAGQQLSPKDREEILAMIREEGRARKWGILWVRAGKAPDPKDLLVGSHLVGEPYAEKGEKWPPSTPPDPEDPDGSSSVPAPFLLQVRLGDSALGPVWQGRLLTVFLQEDQEQIVRSYKDPDPKKYVRLEGGPEVVEAIALEELPIPMEVENETPKEKDEYVEPGPPDFSPRALLERVPGLKERLERHFSDAQGLLTQVLLPDCHGYDLEAPSVMYQGKEASYIQNPHEGTCKICRSPLRFLFQFGDVVPGSPLGDAGVGYVYGCDGHPDACVGYIDSH